MKQRVAFSSRVGNRWSFAVEFEGIGDPPREWNEWWGSLWLWADGQVVGRPFEIEMVMTGLDSLIESAQQAMARANVLSSLPAKEALDWVIWARYGDDNPPKHFDVDPSVLAAHEVLPRLTGAFFDGWEAILITDGMQERFIFRQERGQVTEAKWPIGSFRKFVLEARDEFRRLAISYMTPPATPLM